MPYQLLYDGYPIEQALKLDGTPISLSELAESLLNQRLYTPRSYTLRRMIIYPHGVLTNSTRLRVKTDSLPIPFTRNRKRSKEISRVLQSLLSIY